MIPVEFDVVLFSLVCFRSQATGDILVQVCINFKFLFHWDTSLGSWTPLPGIF